MTVERQETQNNGWIEASGIRHIVRTLRLAVHPSKLGLALIGIILTMLLGSVLDFFWLSTNEGIHADSVGQFIIAKQSDTVFEEQTGAQGLFETWLNHEKKCVHDLLSSSLPVASVAEGTPVGNYLESHSRSQPLWNLAGMVYGVWWLASSHPFFAAVLGLGMLLIWSLAGGAVCRATAMEISRDEKLSMSQAFQYSKRKLFGGFFLAPCIPLGIVAATALLLIAGGMVLRVPVLGDLVSGLAFGFAILGGFAITALAFGTAVGGSLFWPAVAVEGSDAFDAFSRGISYPVSRPWKFLLYSVMTIIYAGACWLFVNLFTFYVLKITRVLVGAGASWFGWWSRGTGDAPTSKIDLLWPMAGVESWYEWPSRLSLAWYEYFSALCIGVYVLLIIGLMWSFLASFYFSGSTVIYFLLRRDADGTDFDDVHIEESEG